MERRINKVRREFDRLGISGFLVIEHDIEPVYIRYLTGTAAEGLLLITLDSSYLFTDGRYQERAKKEAKVSEVIICFERRPTKELAFRALLRPGEKIGFEDSLSHGTVLRLQKLFPENEFVPLSELVEELSGVKEKSEITKIKGAIEITETVFEKHILPLIKPGITTLDLAAKISYWGKKYGTENDAFKPIVLTGPHSSLPHGSPIDKGWRKRIWVGDILQFDFGYFYQGYCSDFSRVVIIGEPTEEQKKIHQIVLEAQRKAIEAVKPSMKAKDLDKIARDFIQEKGYELPHGLGHGIGIKIHTTPHITFVGSEGEEIIKPGQVFTVEPGIYIPGWGGMRIEDDVLVTKDGCEVLTKSPKDLIIL